MPHPLTDSELSRIAQSARQLEQSINAAEVAAANARFYFESQNVPWLLGEIERLKARLEESDAEADA